PGPGHSGHLRLAAELAVAAYLARHTRHFRGEAVELGSAPGSDALQLQDLAFHVHRDLLGEIALGDRRGHLRDIAHLAGEVRRHRVHVVGEVFPGPGRSGHLRLAAELAVAAYLARHTRHFRGEAV